jgi:hypothetical protein
MTAKTRTTASTTTMSRSLMDCSSTWPIPGSAKIGSMITRAPMRVPRFRPRTVRNPNMELRMAWRISTCHDATPLAWAVTT